MSSSSLFLSGLADAADHPQHRSARFRAGVGRSGRDRLDSSVAEYERGDQATGVRSGDANCRALLARSGDDRGRRAGDVDSTPLVERIGGGLDLIEQLAGVTVERPGADSELQRSVLDGGCRGVLTGYRAVALAETRSEAPAGFRNECHVALELHDVAGSDDVVVRDRGIDH